MLCTSIFVRGQNLDRKFFYCCIASICSVTADIFAKILLWPWPIWPRTSKRYGSLTIDFEEYFKLTFDFYFDRGRRSKYTTCVSATPLSNCQIWSRVIVICVSPDCVFPRTHIPRDACLPAHISLIIHILQVIVMRVSPGILFPHHLYANFDVDWQRSSWSCRYRLRPGSGT